MTLPVAQPPFVTHTGTAYPGRSGLLAGIFAGASITGVAAAILMAAPAGASDMRPGVAPQAQLFVVSRVDPGSGSGTVEPVEAGAALLAYADPAVRLAAGGVASFPIAPTDRRQGRAGAAECAM